MIPYLTITGLPEADGTIEETTAPTLEFGVPCPKHKTPSFEPRKYGLWLFNRDSYNWKLGGMKHDSWKTWNSEK